MSPTPASDRITVKSDQTQKGTAEPTVLTRAEAATLEQMGLQGGAFASLAARAVETAIAEQQPGKRAQLVSSNVSSISDTWRGRLSADAVLSARVAPDRQFWRVSILSKIEGAVGSAQPVADVSAVYVLLDDEQVQDQTTALEADSALSESTSGDVGVGQASGLSKKSEKRRRQIFEGACTVIARKGFGNASIREIAQEAGMSVPLMYKHIKDKDEILYLITSECMRDILDYFASAELFSGSSEDNIRHAVDTYIDYIGKNRKYINLVYSETRSLSAEQRTKIFAMERRFMTYWRNLVQMGVSDGSFKPVDPELMANYIYFLCTVWSLRHWSIGHFDEETIKSSLTELILQGLAVPAA